MWNLQVTFTEIFSIRNHLFKSSCTVCASIELVLFWRVAFFNLKMGGGVDGWCTATMSQQDCDVSKEVAESRVDLWKACRDSDWPLSCNKLTSMHDDALSHAARRNARPPLHLWLLWAQKERKSWGGSQPPLTSTLLRTFGASTSKRSRRVGGSSHPPAALGGYSDILQRNLSRNSLKTQKFNGCKNCEAAIK